MSPQDSLHQKRLAQLNEFASANITLVGVPVDTLETRLNEWIAEYTHNSAYAEVLFFAFEPETRKTHLAALVSFKRFDVEAASKELLKRYPGTLISMFAVCRTIPVEENSDKVFAEGQLAPHLVDALESSALGDESGEYLMTQLTTYLENYFVRSLKKV
jgi:hypothetical protein